MDKASQKLHIGVLGAGAWGTALACVAARAGHTIMLWAREADVVRSIRQQRVNRLFLPRQKLPANLHASTDMADLKHHALILLVAPAQHCDAVLRAFLPLWQHKGTLILCAKGVERESLALMPEVAQRYVPRSRVAMLSGPSFAREVAQGLPTALTLASTSAACRRAITSALHSPRFRLYGSSDIIGAAIGGAVKNVLAIACGIADGKKLGQNARAALMTRGFQEMIRLGVALGAKRKTLHGLCGLGDVVLTCASTQSRNFSLGRALAETRSSKDQNKDLMTRGHAVKEGAWSAQAIRSLAQLHKLDLPICAAVADIMDNKTSVNEAIDTLLARPTGKEVI